jgi:cytoskeletal protein CcmA (bactofilin family)
MASSSTISSSTVIVGRVTASTDLEVHGRVEGSIEATGDVVITDEARVKSDVSGKSVTVSGAVAGNLAAQDVVVLESGARVVGDISAPSIGIRSGALVRGRVETGAPGTTKGRRAPAVRAATSSQTKSALPSMDTSARSKKKAPAPVMPKAAGRAKKKTTAKKAGKKAPAPVVPAIKRSKKTAKRRNR